jgi:hypothetical protein
LIIRRTPRRGRLGKIPDKIGKARHGRLEARRLFALQVYDWDSADMIRIAAGRTHGGAAGGPAELIPGPSKIRATR